MQFDAESSMDFCSGLNTKHFIKEVRLRPAIWDRNSEEYNDRTKKKECWEELTYLFLSRSDVATPVSEAERERFTRLLQRRWKNVRDCFTRELLRERKIKSGAQVTRKNTYVYFNLLSFLRNAIKQNPGGVRQEAWSDDDQTNPAVVKTEPHQSRSILYESLCRDTSNDPLDSAKKPGSSKDKEGNSEDDCDRMFLLSLLKPLQKIPEDKRFDVKMEMMRVIHKAQQAAQDDVSMMKFENDTSPVNNFDDEQSLDSIREPPTPTLSETSNIDNEDLDNMELI